jgi:hypothetical protein
VLIADLVGERATREGIASLRADLADVGERIAESEESARARAPPTPGKFPLLVARCRGGCSTWTRNCSRSSSAP